MRDRDVREDIRDRLEATDQFGGVFLSGLPEDFGFGASLQTAAVIEPQSGSQDDKWDAEPTGDLIVSGAVTITFLARDEIPETRDAAVELLFTTAANALNGQSLAELTLPPLTRFASWRWQKATPPERRITSTFNYQYLVPGWGQQDTTE